MRRRILACAASVAALVATVSGCDTGSSGGGGGGRDGSCDEADPAVVKQIMKGARTDFRPTLPDGRPGVQVDHLELLESGAERLPAEDRKFGADRVVVLLTSTVLGGADASDDIGGVEGPVYFALDAKGELLGPVGQFSASLFDLPMPADAGWLEWGNGIEDSTFGGDLYGCVDPD